MDDADNPGTNWWGPPLVPREPYREERWRLISPTGMPAICEIMRVETGFEVRVGQGEDDIIGSDLQPTLGRARQVAELLRAMNSSARALPNLK